MTIASILQGKGDEIISIARTASVAEAVALLTAKRIGALPVMDGDTVVGIFSERASSAVSTALAMRRSAGRSTR
jgi:CBS domain-containing protein